MAGLPRFRSLRTRVVLVAVGMAAMLAVGLSALGYGMAAAGLRERTLSALGADGLLTATLVDGWARERLGNLRALSRLPEVRRILETHTSPAPEDQVAAEHALANAQELAADLESIALVVPGGKVLMSTVTADEGHDISAQAYAQDALAGREHLTGVTLSGITGSLAIFVATPVVGSNSTVIGAARERLSFDTLRALVEAARDRAGPGANGVLVDADGRVIWATLPETRAGTPVSRLVPELAALLGDAAHPALRFRLDGKDQLAALLPVPSARWTWVTTLPRAEAERTAHEFLLRALLGALAGLLLATLLSMLLAGRAVRSLERLTEATFRIADGDLTRDVEVSSDDEVGRLAQSFQQMVRELREALLTLRSSSGALSAIAEDLRESMDAQTEFLTRQSTALQETHVTAQEIRQTSALASDKAQAVLRVAERGDQLGREGEGAVERGLGGLADIGRRASEVSEQILRVSESARQIGGITLTVKDLADQSNMLALNAAIEAVRSGEHGKSFAVVAREIRSLADQSIQATNRVGEILGELGLSISVAVKISDQSTRRMESGMAEVRATGDSLRQLSHISSESVAAVRQIAAAVSQQNAGIGQVFAAVNDQMQMMEQARERLDQTRRASAKLREVAGNVAQRLSRYRL